MSGDQGGQTIVPPPAITPETAADGSSSLRAVRLEPPFTRADGLTWQAVLPTDLSADGDRSGAGVRSRWRLFENGNQIGEPHALHVDIAEQGRGLYSHWKDILYFSTVDGSDPNANDREYELRIRSNRAELKRMPNEEPTNAYEWIPPLVNAFSANADISALAEILRRREVREVVYFHTDHFEPWVGPVENQVRALSRFAQSTRLSPFGRRLSLFYTPLVPFSLADSPRDGQRESIDGDNIVFWRRSPDLEALCRNFLRPLESEIGHEFQVHVHHENWTRTGLPNTSQETANWVNQHSTARADLDRLDLFLRLSLQTLRQDLGRPFEQWAFVHGNWTLNASDERYCQIENEIELLMRHGCIGDFTFPAPNLRCQPSLLQTPYTCLPLSGAKSYDTTAADPRPISLGSGVMQPDRFFIWNSPIPAGQVSLDFFSDENRQRYADPEHFVQIWLERSVVLDGRLYLKTHAHSLDSHYRPWEEDRPFPHTYPDIVVLFEILQKSCDAAGVPMTLATVGEVMRQLQMIDRSDGTSIASARGNADIDAVEKAEELVTASVACTQESEPPPVYDLKKPFMHRAGNSWVARLPLEFEGDADIRGMPQRSEWVLLENGMQLGTAHSPHDDIAELGGGRYSHWATQLYFSTPDNSDPNVNGRNYSLRWMGGGEKPWLAQFADAPLADSIPFGPRADVQSCAGLIAIFGASFSGSTLVNTVLAAHPAIFGGGELHWLLSDPSRSECAICGKACRFWTSEVRASARIESLYHDTSRMFGRSCIVDISKMPAWYQSSLPHYPGLPIVRVLLVKHPVRHVASFIKKRDEFPEYGDAARVIWELRSFYDQFKLSDSTGTRPGPTPTDVDYVIRYEDFVASPKDALAPVLARLGLEYHARMDRWATAEHHHIGGNVGPLVQIANEVPNLAVSARKYRQRGIFLDNSYLEILSATEIEKVASHPDAVWIAERFHYDSLEPRAGPLPSKAPDEAIPGESREMAEPVEVLSLEPPFDRREGFTWRTILPERSAPDCDGPGNNLRSPWHLLEDGVRIGRPHSLHAEIAELGQGRHSHWGDTLYFSTSDNTDPNTNGRRYGLARFGPPAGGGQGRDPRGEIETASVLPMGSGVTPGDRTASPDGKTSLHAAAGRSDAGEPAAINTIEPDTHIPVVAQIERLRAVIGDEEPLGTLFDQAVARLDIARNEALIRRYGATAGLSNAEKYVDCAFWIFQKLRLALFLGLDKAGPLRILDLGTGGGHFCFVCRLLGHKVIGLDLDLPMYRDICALMGFRPVPVKIERGEPLPHFGGRFDLVTAFAAQFDHIGGGELWSKEDWRVFIDHLLRDQMRAPGRIFFTLNAMSDPSGNLVFKSHVAEVFASYGGRDDPEMASVDLPVTAELIASRSATKDMS